MPIRHWLSMYLPAYTLTKRTRPLPNRPRNANHFSMLETMGKHEDAAFAIGTLHLAIFLNQRKQPSEALSYAERSLTMLRRLPVLQPAMEGAAEIALASVFAQLRRATEAQSSAEEVHISSSSGIMARTIQRQRQ